MTQGIELRRLVDSSTLSQCEIAKRAKASQSSLAHQMVRGCSESYYNKIKKVIEQEENTMDENTCKCVGELAKRWIEDFLGIEVTINYMDDYSVELRFWDLPKDTLKGIYNGIEGMCLMYTKLEHLEGKKGWSKQPCLEVYGDKTIPQVRYMRIFTDETNQYADSMKA